MVILFILANGRTQERVCVRCIYRSKCRYSVITVKSCVLQTYVLKYVRTYIFELCMFIVCSQKSVRYIPPIHG